MKKLMLVIIPICVVLLAAIWLSQMPSTPPRTFVVAKAWWPGWDSFQLGVSQVESEGSPFRTVFDQTSDYGPALERFKTSKVDAATLTIYEAILAASDGIPLKIVLLLDYTIGSDGVVAKTSIKSINDLRGKKIGIERGTIGHFTVLKALEQAGIEDHEVTFVNLGQKELVENFIEGKIDAAGIYEPYMFEMSIKGMGHVVFSSKEIPRSICDVLFVKQRVYNQNPDLILHWIASWDHAIKIKKEENEEFLQQLSALNKTSIPKLKRSLKGIYFTDIAENRRAFERENSGYLYRSLTQMHDFMVKHKVIKNRLSQQQLQSMLAEGSFDAYTH